MSVKKAATRDGYGKALIELGKEFENVVVMDADLAEATRTAMFKEHFPERFFDCGIQEANMVDVAAGLSTLGFVPFVSSFAMFAAGRAYEMIRNTVGYPALNVKVCASHGGISVGEDGASHQCNEDFALMRTIPGMTILCPSDSIEAEKMTIAAYHHDGPVYLRTSRFATPVYHDEDFEFEIGKAEMLKDGTDLTLIATGIMVPEALEVANLLKENGLDVQVINMGTLKPLDEKAVKQAALKTGRIFTVEEHSTIGGLGEAVSAYLAENCPVYVHKIGVRDEFGYSGPAGELLEEFGLTAPGIAANVLKQLKKWHRF